MREAGKQKTAQADLHMGEKLWPLCEEKQLGKCPEEAEKWYVMPMKTIVAPQGGKAVVRREGASCLWKLSVLNPSDRSSICMPTLILCYEERNSMCGSGRRKHLQPQKEAAGRRRLSWEERASSSLEKREKRRQCWKANRENVWSMCPVSVWEGKLTPIWREEEGRDNLNSSTISINEGIGLGGVVRRRRRRWRPGRGRWGGGGGGNL